VLAVTVLAALGELAPDLRLGDLRQTLGEGASLEPLLAMLPHTAAASLRARLDGDR
jgi:hypothetical protein